MPESTAGVPEAVTETEGEVLRTLELTAYAAAPAANTPAIERVVAIPTFMMCSFVGRWPSFITVRGTCKGIGVVLSKIHPIPKSGVRSSAGKEAQWGCEGSAG